MSRANTIRQLAYLLLPAVLFQCLHSALGLLPAMLVSLGASLLMAAVHYRRKRRLNNSLVIGFFATLLSITGYLFSGDERAYFVPAVLEHLAFLLLILVLTLRGRCYVFLFLKDFRPPFLEEMDEGGFVSNNYLWLLLFLLKLLIRVALLLADLPFDTRYWIAFLSGDPLALPVIALTYYAFRKKVIAHARSRS